MILYHATGEDRPSDILRDGLRAYPVGGAFDGVEDEPAAVYLAPSPDAAAEWGEYLLAVDVVGLALEDDPHWDGTYRHLGDIPPARIVPLGPIGEDGCSRAS